MTNFNKEEILTGELENFDITDKGCEELYDARNLAKSLLKKLNLKSQDKKIEELKSELQKLKAGQVVIAEGKSTYGKPFGTGDIFLCIGDKNLKEIISILEMKLDQLEDKQVKLILQKE